MSCTVSCHRPSPAQAHCGACHVTFGGVSWFDRHRRGGECVPPAGLGLVEVRGVWRMPMDEAERSRRFPGSGTSRDGRSGVGGSVDPSKINNADLASAGQVA